MDKPHPFSGVYRDRNNIESLLESRTVHKVVLLTLHHLRERHPSCSLRDGATHAVKVQVLSQLTNLSWHARGSVSVVMYLSI